MQNIRTDKSFVIGPLIRKWWPLIFVGTNYVLVMSSVHSFPLSNLLPNHDSSMFMYFGNGMNHGLTPYTQMYDHKGIVLFWIEQLANAIGVGGHFNTGVWVMECLCYAIYLLFMLLAFLQLYPSVGFASTSILATTPLTMTSLQGGNLSEEFALPFIAISMYWFIKVFREDAIHWGGLITIGISGALVFFMRPNMIAIWAVGCLVLLIRGLIRQDWAVLVRQILGILGGGVFVVTLIVIYALLVDNLKEMINLTFLVNVDYTDQATFTQRIQTGQYFWRYAEQYLMILFGAGWLLSSVTTRKFWPADSLLVVYGVLNFLTVVLSGRPYLHYFITMLPILNVMIFLGLAQWQTFFERFRFHYGAPLLALLVIFLVTWPLPTITNLAKTNELNIANNVKAPINYRRHSAVLSLSNYIDHHSSNNDRIYVHWLNANIYLYAHRFAPSRFFVLPSLNYDQHPAVVKEFSSSFQRHSPKFIVVQAGFMTRPQTTVNAVVKKVLTDRYRFVQNYTQPDGSLDLYVLK